MAAALGRLPSTVSTPTATAGARNVQEKDARARPVTERDVPFRYKDPGAVATIGRSRAVADIHLSAYPGWLLWAVLHIASLVGHMNRAVVMIRWAWSYLLRARGGRLITVPSPSAEPSAPLETT